MLSITIIADCLSILVVVFFNELLSIRVLFFAILALIFFNSFSKSVCFSPSFLLRFSLFCCKSLINSSRKDICSERVLPSKKVSIYFSVPVCRSLRLSITNSSNGIFPSDIIAPQNVWSIFYLYTPILLLTFINKYYIVIEK